MSSILFYSEQDPYYQFSNFYLAEITVDGITYPSTEYYYQSSKFRGPHASPADLAYAKKILQVNTSNKAYYLAKQVARGGYSAAWYVSKTDKTLLNDLITQSKRDKVQQRSDWDCVKDNVMRKAVWAKFTQHQQLRDLLVTTKDAQIAEASPRDSYWGLGNDGHGKNMLGRILMEIRAFLAGVFPVSPTARSNWVIPEFVLASAYPGAPDQNKHQETVDALLGTGVNLILSLQQAHEDQAFNSYRDIVAPGFVPPAESFCEKVYSERYGRPVILMRVPIKDQGIVSDAYLDALTDALISAVGRHYQLLIHCLGGKGRSGTVAAVMLGKMYGMSADEALQVLGTSFEGRVNKGTRKAGMPQSKVQFEQVRRMSAGPKSKLAIVGSRDFTDYQLCAEAAARHGMLRN